MSETASTESAQPEKKEVVSDLPDWAKRELSDVRAEAARYRTERNEARTAAEAAKSSFETKIAELNAAGNTVYQESQAKDVQLMKYKAALAVGVPGEHVEQFAGLLQGEDIDSLKSHAESVKAMFAGLDRPDAAKDRSQGFGNAQALNGDPLLADIKAKLNIR